jgi:hypothetical protein
LLTPSVFTGLSLHTLITLQLAAVEPAMSPLNGNCPHPPHTGLKV